MGHHSRRRFLQGSLGLACLTVLSGCAAGPPRVQQPARVPKIGLLFTSHNEHQAEQALREALGALQPSTGKLAIQTKCPHPPYQLSELVDELIGGNVDVIVTSSTPGTVAVRHATNRTPIVMAVAADPLGSGLVDSLERPGGNVTGLSSAATQTVRRRLALLLETAPTVSRVGVLFNPDDPDGVLEVRALQTLPRTDDLQLLSLEVRDDSDYEHAEEDARLGQAEALLTVGDRLASNYGQGRLRQIAGALRVPAIHDWRALVEAGSLMAYTPSFPELYQRAAGYVDKLLKGAKPADLPVEQATKFDFVINLKTAQALGLTIPQSVLAQATEIIQ
jgi:putative ABC transport system substrate-binding protein